MEMDRSRASRPCPDCGKERCSCPIDGYWVGVIALFAVLLCACAADAPPPYTIEYADNVSVADRSLWADAIDRWNAVVGMKVLQWEPQDRKCGRVLIVMDDSIGSADTSRTACNKVVRYRPDYADQCVFEHELGHVLGLEDVVAVGLRNDIGARVIDVPEPPRDTIMRDCNGALQDITDADGAEVRALWGIP